MNIPTLLINKTSQTICLLCLSQYTLCHYISYNIPIISPWYLHSILVISQSNLRKNPLSNLSHQPWSSPIFLWVSYGFPLRLNRHRGFPIGKFWRLVQLCGAPPRGRPWRRRRRWRRGGVSGGPVGSTSPGQKKEAKKEKKSIDVHRFLDFLWILCNCDVFVTWFCSRCARFLWRYPIIFWGGWQAVRRMDVAAFRDATDEWSTWVRFRKKDKTME